MRNIVDYWVAVCKAERAFNEEGTFKHSKRRPDYKKYFQKPHRRKTSHDLSMPKNVRETATMITKAVEAWTEFHKMLARRTAPKEIGAIILRGPEPGQTVVTHEESRRKQENLALNYDAGLPAMLRYPKGLTEEEQKEALAKWTESIKKGQQRP